MTPNGVLQILLFFGLVLLCTKPIGVYMTHVYEGERTLLSPLFRPVEKLFYSLFGVREDEDMKWTTYAFAMLMFSVVGLLFTYALLRGQGHLPLNPKGFGGKDMTPDLAFNTAGSFTTNTNWQSYAPETTISYFSNMVSLAIHNWMSAATGMAVAIALIRGFARRSVNGIGNFWVDMTRGTLYVLLPLSLIAALLFVWQGVPQNFHAYTDVKTLEGAAQSIAQGPVASQEAIKMLGTNGGGFFNANSAHPFENPTPLANLLQMFLIFLIPAGLTYTFGKMVGNTKQGWALFGAMSAMFFTGVCVCYGAEAKGVPTAASAAHILTLDTGTQPGGNMEGKETRFGIANSALFATVTTDASCGAVNAMHDSFHAGWRHGPALQHHDGRVDFWRRGRGTVRHVDVRRDRGLHCGADGGTYARISGQEDRAVRGEDGDAGRPRSCRRHSLLYRALSQPEYRAGSHVADVYRQAADG